MSNDASDSRFYVREFLNNPGHHSLGAVLAEIKDGDSDEGYVDFGATLQIADCSRSVTLDFGVFGRADTKKDRKALLADMKNARHKAELLLDVVDRFVQELDEALFVVEQDLDTREAKAKKAAKKSQKEG